jgi:4-amino-4-deoxy-L-arabinose transferase-like glycosyltransferase
LEEKTQIDVLSVPEEFQGASPEPVLLDLPSSQPEPQIISSKPNRAVLLLGGLLAAILAFSLRAEAYSSPIRAVDIFFIILSIGLFLLGLRENPRKSDHTKLLAFLSWIEKRLHVKVIRCIAFILGACCIYLSILYTGIYSAMKDPILGIGCWIAAIGLTLFSGWQPGSRWRTIPWKLLALPAGLFLLALLIRAIDTAHAPPQLNGDEGSVGLAAVNLLKGNWNNILGISWFSFPALFFAIQAGSIGLFGQTAEALRLPSAFAGSLTVVAVYWLGRELYDHRTGLFGALLLAGLHFHIHFSRLGLNNIWDGFFFTAIPAAFWRAWKTGRSLPFLVVGLLLGFSQYFYVTGRLLPFLVLLWVLVLAVKDRTTFKRNILNLLLMAWMGLVVFAPLGWIYLNLPDNFLSPMTRVSINSQFTSGELTSVWTFYLSLLLHILNGFRGFTDLATRFFYVSGFPVLRPAYAAFFFLGLSFIIRHWRDVRSWMLVSMLFCIAVAGGLSDNTPAAQRYVAGAPIATLIAGYCLSLIISRLYKVWPNRHKWIMSAAIATVVLMAASDIAFYFSVYTPVSLQSDFNTRTAQYLADYLKDKRGDWQVIFFGDPGMGYSSIPSLPYLVPDIKGSTAHLPWGDPDNPVPSSPNVIFVFLRNHKNDLLAAESQYPGGHLLVLNDPVAGPLYWSYEFSPFPSNQ